MTAKIPPGREGLIPHLVCENCGDAIEFYKKAFGAVEVNRMPAPDGKRVMHAAITIDGRALFLADDFPEYCEGKASSPKALGGTPISIHRYVPDCDAAIKRAEDAGATVKMLLIQDPWQVFLSTDHPNGGCFWRYPEIIQLLMCADVRKECLARLPDRVKSRITLPEIDREYTLSEIAVAMSAGPARALGLANKGNLGVDSDADLVLYEDDADVARMFGHPRYVIKAGEIVIEDGDIREAPQGREYLVKPAYEPSTEEFIRPLFEDCYTMSFENYPVEIERIEHPHLHDCVPVTES